MLYLARRKKIRRPISSKSRENSTNAVRVNELAEGKKRLNIVFSKARVTLIVENRQWQARRIERCHLTSDTVGEMDKVSFYQRNLRSNLRFIESRAKRTLKTKNKRERRRKRAWRFEQSARLFMETTHQLNYFIVPDWSSISAGEIGIARYRHRPVTSYASSHILQPSRDISSSCSCVARSSPIDRLVDDRTTIIAGLVPAASTNHREIIWNFVESFSSNNFDTI